MISLSRRGAGVRGFVLALALTLTLFVVAAAGHRHERQVEAHACALCAMLADELPSGDALPPVVATALAAQRYLVLCALAYVCWYRRPRLTPPSCGPPACASAT